MARNGRTELCASGRRRRDVETSRRNQTLAQTESSEIHNGKAIPSHSEHIFNIAGRRTKHGEVVQRSSDAQQVPLQLGHGANEVNDHHGQFVARELSVGRQNALGVLIVDLQRAIDEHLVALAQVLPQICGQTMDVTRSGTE